MKPIHVMLTAFTGLILLLGLILFIRLAGIADTKYLGTIDQNAQRAVYENTKAYRDGVRRDLDDLRLSYLQAKTPDEKAAVLSVMRHRAESVPPELLSADVKSLLQVNP